MRRIASRLSPLWPAARAWLRAFWARTRHVGPRAIVVGGLLGLLAQLNLLGLQSAFKEQSEAVFARIVGAPTYPSPSLGQRNVTVVLIDDDFLASRGEQWPLPYGKQAALISSILRYQPAALFVDVLHRHRHTGDETFGTLLRVVEQPDRIASGGGVPVYLPVPADAASTPEEGCGAGLTGEVAGLGDSNLLVREARSPYVKPVVAGWAGCANRYPLFQAGQPTAALALFKSYCESSGDPACGEVACRAGANPRCASLWCAAGDADCQRRRAAAYAGRFEAPIAVHWGTVLSDTQRRLYAEAGVECQEVAAGVSSRAAAALRQFALALGQTLSSRSERGARAPCPYTDTIPAGYLYGSSEELHATLQSLLGGRIVLLGTRLQGVDDSVVSPVNGQVPGVFLTAMALDNLITYKDRYHHAPTEALQILVEVACMIALVFWAYMLISPAGAPEHGTGDASVAVRAQGALRSKAKSAARWTLPIVFPVICAMALWLLLRWPPMNWVEIALLGMARNLSDLDSFVEERTEILLHKVKAFFFGRPAHPQTAPAVDGIAKVFGRLRRVFNPGEGAGT